MHSPHYQVDSVFFSGVHSRNYFLRKSKFHTIVTKNCDGIKKNKLSG